MSDSPLFDQRLPLPDTWLAGAGPERDVVVSSRMRLARNVAGFRFKSRFRKGESTRLEVRLREVLEKLDPPLHYLPLGELSATLREVLFERHLISREHVADESPRGVAYSDDGRTSVMVNEEDHLRLQVFAAGFDLPALERRVQSLDEQIGASLEYSFSERYGYLTSCPTNTGTGLRVSVMLHLPALSMRGEGDKTGEPNIVKVHNAAQKLGLAVRGLHGESSRAEGDFYQISNQVTLGRAPGEAVADLVSVLPKVVEFERKMRTILASDDRPRLEDTVWRAWGLLTNARRMSSSEALGHLSSVRLGVCLDLVKGTTLSTIQGLMISMRSGHLQHAERRELSPVERDVVRARLIRDTLDPP